VSAYAPTESWRFIGAESAAQKLTRVSTVASSISGPLSVADTFSKWSALDVAGKYTSLSDLYSITGVTGSMAATADLLRSTAIAQPIGVEDLSFAAKDAFQGYLGLKRLGFPGIEGVLKAHDVALSLRATAIADAVTLAAGMEWPTVEDDGIEWPEVEAEEIAAAKAIRDLPTWAQVKVMLCWLAVLCALVLASEKAADGDVLEAYVYTFSAIGFAEKALGGRHKRS